MLLSCATFYKYDFKVEEFERLHNAQKKNGFCSL